MNLAARRPLRDAFTGEQGQGPQGGTEQVSRPPGSGSPDPSPRLHPLGHREVIQGTESKAGELEAQSGRDPGQRPWAG